MADNSVPSGQDPSSTGSSIGSTGTAVQEKTDSKEVKVTVVDLDEFEKIKNDDDKEEKRHDGAGVENPNVSPALSTTFYRKARLGQEVSEGQTEDVAGSPGPSNSMSSPRKVDFPTKIKRILKGRGSYQRVAPDPDRQKSKTGLLATGSTTSSCVQQAAVVSGGPAKDQIVYTVQTTNNNLNDNFIDAPSSTVVCNRCPTHRTGSVDSYEEVCRICHDNSTTEPFITPCMCKGSMGLVHQRCLERWLGESAKTICEICGYEYVTERRPKYRGCSSVWSWVRNPINPHDTKNLFFDVACFFVLTPLACVSAWLCVIGSEHYATAAQERYKETMSNNRWNRYRQFQDASNSTWTSVGLLTLTGTLLTAYYIWLFVAFRYHYQVWRDWQGRNYQVTVLPVTPDIVRAHEESSNAARNTGGTRRGEDVTVVINMEQQREGDAGSSSSSSCSNDGAGQASINTFNNNLVVQGEETQEISSTQSI